MNEINASDFQNNTQLSEKIPSEQFNSNGVSSKKIDQKYKSNHNEGANVRYDMQIKTHSSDKFKYNSENTKYVTPQKSSVSPIRNKSKDTALMNTVTKASTGKKNFIPKPVF